MIEAIKNGIPNNLTIPDELELLVNWTQQNGYPISGCFELRADDGDTMFYWFGFRDVESRLGQFGAGADGSLYCIWDDGKGNFPIVHMGSEGDENKILANCFIDFLRLLAIGYEEIGFEDMSEPPEVNDSNPKFQSWVTNTFSVSIPKCGSEITDQAQTNGQDFNVWINKVIEKYS
mgnify:CR=1 FL=1